MYEISLLNDRESYVWNPDSNLYAGIKVLTSAPWNHYALDNITGGGGGIDMGTDFTSPEKYQALSTPRATAGGHGPRLRDRPRARRRCYVACLPRRRVNE